MKNKAPHIFLAVLSIAVCAAGFYYVATTSLDAMFKVLIIGGVSACFVGLFIYLGIVHVVASVRNKFTEDSRPILCYLGRVLTKAESAKPRAEATINKLLIASSEKTKVTVGLEGSSVIPFEDLMEDESSTPVIIIRPFYFANYGKGIAIGLTIMLDGEKITDRIDYVIEPNAKISMEITDAIEFKKGMKYFTLSYSDIFGNDYVLKMDGIIERAEEESVQLERDVYLYYVDNFTAA